jgi:hypothetical protein
VGESGYGRLLHLWREWSAGHFITDSVITNNHSASFTGGVYLGGGTGQVGTVTVKGSIVAGNSALQSADVDISTADPTNRPFDSDGNNRLGNGAAGFQQGTNGDHIGNVNYIVTGIADTYNHTDDATVMSTLEAIDLANTTPGAQEIWLPAWNFQLTIDRNWVTHPTDTNVEYGDLDIKQSLIIRGVTGSTSVTWRVGAAADAVFDLLGDYNGDGMSSTDSGLVDDGDYIIWRATKNQSVDLRADGNDDGTVNQLDYDVYRSHVDNALTLLGAT